MAKQNIVSLSLKDDHLTLLDNQVKKLGVTRSSYLRMLILKEAVVDPYRRDTKQTEHQAHA